ncbi:hypothetical protein Rhow_002394 [Rhodococcus wratislaviensis]|uniref:Uncharacterized protein n=1 Tax=Rhodococcus wratislaviensis TaxID=44752 RepID=A0A402C5G9_RHOWR|nr:hypothetical protein Rhow_002394 [Rhodococcus wratislaviensis]
MTDLVTRRVKNVQGRISAKRLHPIARTAGYDRSDRNFPAQIQKRSGAANITADAAPR